MTYKNHMRWGYDCLGVLSCSQTIKWPIHFGNCLIVQMFVVPSNHFEKVGLVIFMYHVFIIIQHMTSQKSAMSCDYLWHVANSSCLSNWGQTLAHPKNHLKRCLFLTLDESLLPSNNSQSRSRLTTIVEQRRWWSWLEHKGSPNICCWWAQAKKQRYNISWSFFFADFVLRPKLEKDVKDKNSEVDLDATLKEDFGSTT